MLSLPKVHSSCFQNKNYKSNKTYTAQKMKFSIKNFFGKCDQIRSFLWIWPHLLKKPSMENFIFLCSDTLLFSWLASNFLEHFYSCLSPFLTNYFPPPEIYFLQIYLNWFFLIPHEILYT